MSAFLNPPLAPRNGHALEIVIACRVSDPKPGKQDERSLDDQEAEHRAWIEAHTEKPFNVTVVAGSGSGEWLERQEYQKLIDLVESGRFDLVLTEDLGRIVRRIHAHLFCEHCVDNEVRLIAHNDHVDTALDGWEDRSIFSAWHHERSNRDTSDRIKRTHRNRFSNGGCLPLLIFCYEKPLGAKSDDDIIKILEFEPILKEWFRRLDEGATYAEIADWLNDQGVPVGPYCRMGKWTGTMVARVTHNWLLKGIRFRNKRRTRRNNKTGKYKSEKAPHEALLTRRVPHLAFFDEAYYDRVVAKADANNAKYRRNDSGNGTVRRLSKKRSRFPGQSIYCGVCGRVFVFGGHGQKDHLMCSGAREYKCWNAITFDGPDACKWLSEAILDQIETLPAFEPEFLALLEDEIAQTDTRRTAELRAVEREQQKNQREIENILDAIRAHGSSTVLLNELARLERKASELALRHSELQATPSATIEIPSIDVVKQIAREEFSRLTIESYEFARFMRRLLPSMFVFPFRLCDGGAIALRASVTLTAAPLVSREAASLSELAERLTRQFCVDLFDPPQREKFREYVVRLRLEGQTEREIAAKLKITTTAAQRAMALQREMDSLGITDPRLPVREPPSDIRKLRRHLHKRYKFEPLEGFPREWPQ